MGVTEIQCKKTGPTAYEMTGCIPSSEVVNAFNQAYRSFQKKVSLPGFRKGRTPIDYIRKNHLPEVQRQVAGNMIEKAYIKGIRENQLNPAEGSAQFDFKPPAENHEFRFKVSFEVHPKVEVKVYENFQINIQKKKPSLKDVDRVIQNLMKSSKPDQKLTKPPTQPNDEWAKKFSENSLEDLKKTIFKSLEVKAEEAYQEELKVKVLEQLIEKNPVEAPKSLIQSETNRIIESAKNNLKKRGLSESDIEKYVKDNQNNIVQQTKFNIQASYLIYALARQLNMGTSTDEVLKYLTKQGIDKKIKVTAPLIESFRRQMTQNKVLDFLIKKSSVKH